MIDPADAEAAPNLLSLIQPENGDRKKSFCAEGMMHSEM